jgi:hypothetical protein
MNIPASAITPFEPLGIPKLSIGGNIIWGTFSKALDELNSYSKSIRGAMLKRSMYFYIRDALHEADAEFVSIYIHGPYCGTTNPIPVCHVTVDCKMPGKPMRHMGGPIWSTGGFE